MDSASSFEMTSPPSLSPATNPTAQRLLTSQKSRQIEIWLDETMYFEDFQQCGSSTDKLQGHAADMGLDSSGKSVDKPVSSAKSFLSAGPSVCPVCDKPFADTPPTTAKSSISPVLSIYKATKTTALLRGIKTAASPFSFTKSKRNDPALSTNMFGSDKNLQVDQGQTYSPAAESFLAPSIAKSDSSDDDNAGVNRILSDRAARLQRAQKLLEKSHLNKDLGQ